MSGLGGQSSIPSTSTCTCTSTRLCVVALLCSCSLVPEADGPLLVLSHKQSRTNSFVVHGDNGVGYMYTACTGTRYI